MIELTPSQHAHKSHGFRSDPEDFDAAERNLQQRGGRTVGAYLKACLKWCAAQVALTNGTSGDADHAAIVYWLTSVARPGVFGNGNDGSLDPSVIGSDYVGGSEPAEAVVPAAASSTVAVDIPLGGAPKPPGLR